MVHIVLFVVIYKYTALYILVAISRQKLAQPHAPLRQDLWSTRANETLESLMGVPVLANAYTSEMEQILDHPLMHSCSRPHEPSSFVTELSSMDREEAQIRQSVFFSAAERDAGVSFLDHHLLECDSSGREWTNMDHDITLRIPEGALAEGEKIHFEVGVAMYGPFIFPENTQPISPILYLRKLEDTIQIKKCIQLTIPHCYKGPVTPSHPDIESRLFFATAALTSSNVDSEVLYSLKEWESDVDFDIDDNHGTFDINSFSHNIFCIMKREHSHNWYSDIGFSLARVDIQPSQNIQEFHFYALFDLDTHKRALEGKLAKKGQNVSSLTPFKFHDESQPYLKFTSLSSNTNVFLHPANGQIIAADINFWTVTFEEFKRWEENDTYPPRIEVMVHPTRHGGILPVKFIGCSEDSHLECGLPLPSAIVDADLPPSSSAQVDLALPSANTCYDAEIDVHQSNVVEDLSLSSGAQIAQESMIASPQANPAAVELDVVGEGRNQDIFVPEVPQSAFFAAAEKGAGVPFLDHQLIECDSGGREWTNVDHDITLRIPEGALAEGEKIHFEVGVAMYGPFIFPENTRPISPILWLCILEEDVELKKPFQVVLPHYLTGIPKERVQYHQVGFAKASHNDYSVKEDGQVTFKFQKSEIEPILASSGYRSYAVLVSKHCCFYCLQAKHTVELVKDAGYCLTRIESFLTPEWNEIYFSVTYFLRSCLKSLDEQFPRSAHQVSRGFKFKDSNKPLQIIVPSEHDQCVIAMDPASAKIKPSEVDFWSKSFDYMQLQHERNMYPPRVKMTVRLRNPDFVVKLPIKFDGHVHDAYAELDVELSLPLGLSSLSPTSSGAGSLNIMEPRSDTIICEKPKLRDAFRKLLPLASRWKTIGTLLDIPKHILDKIQSDEDGVEDRLQGMLSEWLKQVDPPPKWKDLADAVDDVDKEKAKEIRDQCVDI